MFVLTLNPFRMSLNPSRRPLNPPHHVPQSVPVVVWCGVVWCGVSSGPREASAVTVGGSAGPTAAARGRPWRCARAGGGDAAAAAASDPHEGMGNGKPYPTPVVDLRLSFIGRRREGI